MRARLNTLASFPEKWAQLVEDMRAQTAEYRPRDLDGRSEYIIWQTLVGTWSDRGPIGFERLKEYLLKAAREQKTWTSWTSPDTAREGRLVEFAERVLADPQIGKLVAGWRKETSGATSVAILATKALQLTMPGVADLYQGSEVVGTNLVDPDNRRPVDFAGLSRSLRRLEEGASPETLDEQKLDVVRKILALRAKFPQVFVSASSAYWALPVSTSHALAFARGIEKAQVLSLIHI